MAQRRIVVLAGLHHEPAGIVRSDHAGLTVTAVGDGFQIYDEDRLLTEVLRRTTKPIARAIAQAGPVMRTSDSATSAAHPLDMIRLGSEPAVQLLAHDRPAIGTALGFVVDRLRPWHHAPWVSRPQEGPS